MSFDFNTLITDRTQEDVSYLSALLKKPLVNWTEEELEQFNAGMLKGGYSWADLNRVTECMEYLAEELAAAGYACGYSGIILDRPKTPVVKLPEGYTEIEYIKSSGNQWFDTEIITDTETVIQAKISMQNTTGNIILGHGDGGDSNDFRFFNYGNNFYLDVVSSRLSGGNFLNDTEYTLEIGNNYLKDLSTGENILYGDKVQNIPGYTIKFLSAGDPVLATMFWLKIKTGSGLQGDFIPGVDESGKAGMYDVIRNKFFTSLSSESFLSGQVKPPEYEESTLSKNRWYKEDTMTTAQVDKFLHNVNAIVSTLSLSQSVPTTMKKFTVSGANDIENALKIVNETLEKLKYNMLPCGDAYCGGDFA